MADLVLEKIEEKFSEHVAKFKEFLHEKYFNELVAAANEENPLVVDFRILWRLLVFRTPSPQVP